jgi:hypothetical protein
MKRCWGGILAWLVVVCRLWSLGLQASDQHLNTCVPKRAAAWQTKSRSVSSRQTTRTVRRTSTRSRAGPQQFFFVADVFLRVQDLCPVGPPWLEYRGPPGIYRNFRCTVEIIGRNGRDGSSPGAAQQHFYPNFLLLLWPESKAWGFATGFS